MANYCMINNHLLRAFACTNIEKALLVARSSEMVPAVQEKTELFMGNIFSSYFENNFYYLFPNSLYPHTDRKKQQNSFSTRHDFVFTCKNSKGRTRLWWCKIKYRRELATTKKKLNLDENI